MSRSLFIFLVAFQAGAASSWYVDKDNTGETNGTSWATAWLDPSHVKWGVGGVVAGDTLYISGGSTSKTYTNSWWMDSLANGTPSSPITIRVGQDSGHNGWVIFDGTSHGTVYESQWTILGNYVTVDGSVNGASRMMFANMVSTESSSTPVALYRDDKTVGTIHHVVFTNVNNGITIGYTTNSSIYSCEFHIRGDSAIEISQPGTDWDQVLIYSNSITSWIDAGPAGDDVERGGPDGIQCQSGMSIYANTFRCIYVSRLSVGQHPDFIQCIGGRWFKFYGNEIIDVGDSGIDIGPTLNADGARDIRIYNNIFRQTQWFIAGPEFIRLTSAERPGTGFPDFYQNVWILNNLFVGNSNAATQIVLINADIQDAGNVGVSNSLSNNIWVNCAYTDNTPFFTLNGSESNPSVWTITNNVYHPSDGAVGYVIAKRYSGTYISAADWISTYEPVGTTNLPSFISYTTGGDSDDFHLQSSDTVARNRGIDFSTLFTTDFDGNPRSGTWDIGPYQYMDNASASLRVGTLRVNTLRVSQ